MSSYTVYLEGHLAGRLPDRVDVDGRRRMGTGGDGSLKALVDAFEAEGRKCFRRAESASTGLLKGLVLQARGEAWLQAATQLREAAAAVEPSVPMG